MGVASSERENVPRCIARALIGAKRFRTKGNIIAPCIIDNYCRLTYGRAFKMELTFIKRNRGTAAAVATDRLQS